MSLRCHALRRCLERTSKTFHTTFPSEQRQSLPTSRTRIHTQNSTPLTWLPRKVHGTSQIVKAGNSQFFTLPDILLDSLAGATTLALAYGLEIQQTDDRYLQIAERAVIGLAETFVPGRFLVDSIPLLKYVPSWMPGAGFKRKAKEWKALATEMMDSPFEAAQKAIVRTTIFYLYMRRLIVRDLVRRNS